ncbi:glycoside hydrolase family 13 protein [Dothistroma septosporum NZE10]|uniref:alpha-amylase n=1 Tax=Dothistroma septosporum (strain NZE10 / CBS 128990) TaxID=675120 RepID=N1PQF6_DOTSN|nr:glycoside hydrolase family 13 protein [Dothistroma septosporum NZE10]
MTMCHLQSATAMLCCLLGAWSSAATLDDWRTRVVYQVLTDRFSRAHGSTHGECNFVDGRYCGGSWKGISERLDYIEGMGFDAVWISPVVAQLTASTGDGESYTGYWAQDLYALNPSFGTEDDLRDLIQNIHDRGMYIMLDLVVNHMGYAGAGSDVDYSIFNPFNDRKYFHDYCRVDGDNNQTNIEKCWLGDDIVALADLRTEDDDVREMFGDWISSVVANYSIDGLRLDTTVNVEPEFFESFVKSAGVFATGETMDGDNSLICQWAETIGSILNYAIYYPLTRTFSSPTGSINDLVSTIYTTRHNCLDPTAYGLFSENHDVERFAEMTEDMAQAKNIITYTIMGDGIPIIYQGQEQHMAGGTVQNLNRAPLWSTAYNTDAELYKHISTLTKARHHFVRNSGNYTTYISDVIYQDYHTFATRKGYAGGQAIIVFNNNGAHTDDFEVYITKHDFEPGTNLTEILTCTDLSVNRTGYITVPMGQGLPKVIYPKKQLKDSGLCGQASPSSIATAVPTAHSTTINGHPTLVATTTDAEPSGTSSGKTSHTRLALGTASQVRLSPGIPVTVTVLSILAASLGAALMW